MNDHDWPEGDNQDPDPVKFFIHIGIYLALGVLLWISLH